MSDRYLAGILERYPPLVKHPATFVLWDEGAKARSGLTSNWGNAWGQRKVTTASIDKQSEKVQGTVRTAKHGAPGNKPPKHSSSEVKDAKETRGLVGQAKHILLAAQQAVADGGDDEPEEDTHPFHLAWANAKAQADQAPFRLSCVLKKPRRKKKSMGL